MTWHCSTCDTNLDTDNRLQHFIDKHNFVPAQIEQDQHIEHAPVMGECELELSYELDGTCTKCNNQTVFVIHVSEMFYKTRCSKCNYCWFYKRWYDRKAVITDGITY